MINIKIIVDNFTKMIINFITIIVIIIVVVIVMIISSSLHDWV